ncbi:hypothetical protein [Arthrobacter sp. VKM Ac-2550]|uniref:hypothetical protein n=1 Tax=Crystallibacter permensis TaxID=1938888 RepID=UPI00222720FF|nr:hypothetical protein [Arthrobacter sp. VKM Ac-2550]MCW2131638.1 hypothetical protein [Arthrobacter sp. VKM Ac-2550]
MTLSEQDQFRSHRPAISSRRMSWELVLAACGLLAAALIALDASDPVSGAFRFIVWMVLPGWAIVRRFPIPDPAGRLVCTAVASAVTSSLLAVLMGWAEIWHPRSVAVSVLIASCALLVLKPADPKRRKQAAVATLSQTKGFKSYLPWFFLAAAVLLWAIALPMADAQLLGDLGLLTELPVVWYLAVALNLGLCVWGIAKPRISGRWFLATAITGLTVMLYATASLLAEVPRLPWVYKHIAVTDFISAAGQVDPSIDIYNRWPGFFATSAFLGEMSGYSDAVSYASWAEIGFALVDVTLVLAIARTLSKNPRVYWTSALVFVVTNWVNQNYYSPQAFSFTLYLTMCLIALTFLRGNPIRWVGAVERRLLRRHRALPKADAATASNRRLGTAAITAMIVLQAVIVVGHQLTPYLAILGLFPLFIAGYFRPRWLGPVLLLMAIAYLVPNFEYVEKNYGLFSGFDVFSNASNTPRAEPLTNAGRLAAHGAIVLSILTGLLGVAGYVRRLLRGEVRTTLMVAWLAVAPAFGLLGQSYGGEARFRVYLFALPWLAIGVAWLFWSASVRTRKTAVKLTACLAIMTTLFTTVYFRPEADYRVSREDVVAGKWLDQQVRQNDLVFETNYFFPLLIGPNYPHYLEGGTITSLTEFLAAHPGRVTAQDVENHAKGIRSAENIYLVFSDRQYRHADAHKLFEAETLPKLEQEMFLSADADKVFDNGAVRIYRLGGMQ